jgi:phosphohistidine swiveling domain-containing protein
MFVALTDPTEGYSDPDRYWTQANIREACPEVLSPLCWSLWVQVSQRCTRETWRDFGLIPSREVPVVDDANVLTTGCFYGRQAMNVDVIRAIVARAPGASPDDLERDVLGYVRPNPPRAHRSVKRYPLVAARMPGAIIRQRRGVERMHERQLAWWRGEVLGETRSLSPHELLDDAERRFIASMRLHLYSRANLLPATQGPLTTLATAQGGPELATQVIGGLGHTVEAEIADDLWAISRGRRDIAAFIRDHGFHGPSEGNPIARSWRENDAPLRALARVYAKRPDDQAPRTRERRAVEAHERAAATLLRGLRGPRRLLTAAMLDTLRTQVRYLGLGKASFLMGIDGVRAAVRRIGAENVRRGLLDEPDDAFFLTLAELRGPLPDNLRELVAFRRQRRREYEQIELPTTWHGVPEPRTPAASGRDQADAKADAEITGLPGSGGVAEGRVRVVVDPADADELEPGEILVCRFTDPSWAALFPLAEAVVIDLGGPASHGAVVSRELGIPCVIGTDDGTRRLRTGDLIRVDGGVGSVTLLERAVSAAS